MTNILYAIFGAGLAAIYVLGQRYSAALYARPGTSTIAANAGSAAPTGPATSDIRLAVVGHVGRMVIPLAGFAWAAKHGRPALLALLCGFAPTHILGTLFLRSRASTQRTP